MDSGLLALALVARLHQRPVDAAQLQHQFARSNRPCDRGDILRAAGQLGFRARALQCRERDLTATMLPAITLLADGEYGVLARLDEVEAGVRRYLVQRANVAAPVMMTAAELSALWAGELILLRPRGALWRDATRPFNLGWFLPALVKYRRQFTEVLVASFSLQLFALVTPLYFQVVMDKVLVHRGFSTLDVLAFGFAVVIVFEAAVGGLRNYLFSHTTNRVDVELGARLFDRLVRLPLAYFEARQIGHTVARVRELETIRAFLTGSAMTLLVDLSFTFVFFAVLWYYSPTLTWIVVASLPCYVLLSVLVTPVLRHRLEQQFQTGAANQAFLTEAVAGIQTVKAQAVEPQLQRRWEEQLAEYVTAAFRATNLGNIANQCAGLISKVVTLLIVWWGAHLVIGGALTVGQLVAFNMIAGRITAPVLKLVQMWQDFQQAGISLRRLGDILDSPPEAQLQNARSHPPVLAGRVQLQRVRFRYRPDAPLVLDELNLDIPPGAVIGVVGPSGSGKSTLAKLLQRLYVPEAGRVLLDGIDLALIDPAWLRRQVGVVQQDSFLFNRSVRDNIALADPGAPFERVLRCAQAAGAHDFIIDLPEAYDTVVHEQGCNLSGGQRQRIAIARALLADPRVLILDEATSALDFEAERMLQERMHAICRGRTVFIIAHRLSSLRRCDHIVVLVKGRIAEAGTHAELLARGGYYASLFAYQYHPAVVRALGAPVADTTAGRAAAAQDSP